MYYVCLGVIMTFVFKNGHLFILLGLDKCVEADRMKSLNYYYDLLSMNLYSWWCKNWDVAVAEIGKGSIPSNPHSYIYWYLEESSIAIKMTNMYKYYIGLY